MHCSVRALPDDDALELTDHGSTNGTFVEGRRIAGVARLPDRAVLQIGRHLLLHEFRPRVEVEQAEQTDRDLERARHYVEALLPAPIASGPVRTEWFFQPSAMLGGDAFGTLRLDDRHFAGYVIDVSGHGAGVAMHTVTVMNVLRQRALPNTDFADPAQVLTRLNAMFQMDAHDGLFLTMWYGVYDLATRRLAYAAAGHHPAYLRAQRGGPLQPLALRQPPVGAAADIGYRAAAVDVAPGARLYLFSDGLFEYTDRARRPCTLADFLPLLEASDPGPGEPERLYQTVRERAVGRPLEDDCSIITVTFL